MPHSKSLSQHTLHPGWPALTLACACLLVRASDAPLLAQAPPDAALPDAASPPAAPSPRAPPLGSSPADGSTVKLSPEQLDSLVAPIALYPDPLLAQALAASTYPLEIIQLQQWLLKNPGLQDKALADAVAQQPWDPAVQSLAAIPDLTKRLADDIQWTNDLGNAFLAQQTELLDAVQRMRKKAQDRGALASNQQQKVETKVIETKEVIIVESAQPEVVYVPVYNPTVVYGPPAYPYPPAHYPPYTPGAALVTFGVGMVIGAAIWGGTCCGCGWGHGHGSVHINVHNHYNRNTNINRGGNNSWRHHPEHRGGTPYGDRATADRFGGSARGDSVANRQQPGGAFGRGQGARPSPRAGGNASSTTGLADRSLGGGGDRNRGAGERSSGAGSSHGRGGDRIGSHEIGAGSASSRGGGFGNAGSFSGNSARASSSRGASSFGGRAGGGGGRRR